MDARTHGDVCAHEHLAVVAGELVLELARCIAYGVRTPQGRVAKGTGLNNPFPDCLGAHLAVLARFSLPRVAPLARPPS